jgi:hypothetical protein
MAWNDVLKSAGVSADALSRIRLGPGVVGKTTYGLIAVVVVLGTVAWPVTNEWLRTGLGLLVALVFVLYFVCVMWFAHKNPGAALLEGAELLQWQHEELVSKGAGILPRGRPVKPGKALPPRREHE